MKISLRALCALLIASAAFAQDAAPALDTVKSALGIPVPANMPISYIAVGAGVHQGQPLGWINMGKAIAPGVYLAGATDMSAGVQSARAGLETCLYCDTQHGVYLSLKGDGGGSFGNGLAGGSYGLGGSLAIRLGRGSSKHIVVSAGLVGTEARRFVTTPITRGSVQQLVSGATFRIGLLSAALGK